jgi:hypothetical protein
MEIADVSLNKLDALLAVPFVIGPMVLANMSNIG